MPVFRVPALAYNPEHGGETYFADVEADSREEALSIVLQMIFSHVPDPRVTILSPEDVD